MPIAWMTRVALPRLWYTQDHSQIDGQNLQLPCVCLYHLTFRFPCPSPFPFLSAEVERPNHEGPELQSSNTVWLTFCFGLIWTDCTFFFFAIPFLRYPWLQSCISNLTRLVKGKSFSRLIFSMFDSSQLIQYYIEDSNSHWVSMRMISLSLLYQMGGGSILSLSKPWPALFLSMIHKADNTTLMVILPVNCNLIGGLKYFMPP